MMDDEENDERLYDDVDWELIQIFEDVEVWGQAMRRRCRETILRERLARRR